jgi:hypothetical protein
MAKFEVLNGLPNICAIKFCFIIPISMFFVQDIYTVKLPFNDFWGAVDLNIKLRVS